MSGRASLSFRIPYGARSLLVQLALLLGLFAAAPAAARDVHVLAIGDSLTTGHGLAEGQGFVPQLQAALRRHGVRGFVHNAGVSGDTAAAARSRLEWALEGLPKAPDLAIVALGGNDMLRGLPPAETRAALDGIVAELRRRDIPVLLAGMRAAPNLGTDYAGRFEAIYPELARAHGASLHPFFLEGVAGERSLNQADGIHPNFQGIKRMVTAVLPALLRAIGR